MSLTNKEIIEGVIQELELLRGLIWSEGGTGHADFSDWIEDIDEKIREAQAALVAEQEHEEGLYNGEQGHFFN